jgi:hypothetical protein
MRGPIGGIQLAKRLHADIPLCDIFNHDSTGFGRTQVIRIIKVPKNQSHVRLHKKVSELIITISAVV